MTLCENIGCIRSETGHSESASLLPRAFCFANVCPLRLFPSGVQALLLPQPCVQPLSSLFGQALDLLVTVSYTRYRASTSDLSTSSSLRGLTILRYGIPYLEVSFTLRCFQRLSAPHFATLPCRWRDNRCTIGAFIPVLSY